MFWNAVQTCPFMASPLACTPRYAMTRLSIDSSPLAEYIGTGGTQVSLTRRVRVRGHLRWSGIDESKDIGHPPRFSLANMRRHSDMFNRTYRSCHGTSRELHDRVFLSPVQDRALDLDERRRKFEPRQFQDASTHAPDLPEEMQG